MVTWVTGTSPASRAYPATGGTEHVPVTNQTEEVPIDENQAHESDQERFP